MSQSASTLIETSQASVDRTPLPDGWHWVRLGDIGNVVNGYGFTEHLQGRTDLPFPFIKVSDMNAADAETVISKAANTVDETILKKLRARTYPPGTVIFPKVGGALLTNKKRLLGVEATFDNNVMGIVPKDVDSQFLFYWMQSFDLRTLANIQAIPSIRQSDVAALKIPLPSSSEQKRIAAVLKEQMAVVEQARAAAKAQLKAAKDLPAAYLRAVFDDAESQGWQFVKVGDISSLIIDGPHVTPMYVSKGVPFVTVRNIVNRRVDLSQVSYITDTDHAEFTRRGKAERGDILYTKDGTLGIPCVVDTDEEFSFFVSVALIKLNRERADPRFVAHALESPAVLKQVELLGAGAGLKHMVLRSIRALEIPLPPLPKQRKIAAALNEQMVNVEQTKNILTDQLNSINKLPAALLQQAFTGKL